MSMMLAHLVRADVHDVLHVWEERGDRGDECYRAHDYIGAEREYLAAISFADRTFHVRDHGLIDQHFGSLVRVWAAMGIVDEKLRDPWPVDVHGEDWQRARAHWLKALLYSEKGDYAAAEKDTLITLELAELLVSPESREWRFVLNRMAFLRAAQGDLEAAVWWYRHPGNRWELSTRLDPFNEVAELMIGCLAYQVEGTWKFVDRCYTSSEARIREELHARHPAMLVQWTLHADALRHLKQKKRATALTRQADALEAELRREAQPR
ncbi:MAG: hypothetical protein AB2A00_21080 [Myxococcota bacterium]